jgi:hypothetical protein
VTLAGCGFILLLHLSMERWDEENHYFSPKFDQELFLSRILQNYKIQMKFNGLMFSCKRRKEENNTLIEKSVTM